MVPYSIYEKQFVSQLSKYIAYPFGLIVLRWQVSIIDIVNGRADGCGCVDSPREWMGVVIWTAQ